jgi:hypothetical protein
MYNNIYEISTNTKQLYRVVVLPRGRIYNSNEDWNYLHGEALSKLAINTIGSSFCFFPSFFSLA